MSVKVKTNGGGRELDQITLQPSDVLSGKKYIDKDGEIQTGTYTLKSATADATATAASIKKGQTAYINGQKVVGTYNPAEHIRQYNTSGEVTAYGGVSGKQNSRKFYGCGTIKIEHALVTGGWAHIVVDGTVSELKCDSRGSAYTFTKSCEITVYAHRSTGVEHDSITQVNYSINYFTI